MTNTIERLGAATADDILADQSHAIATLAAYADGLALSLSEFGFPAEKTRVAYDSALIAGAAELARQAIRTITGQF